MGLRKGTVVQNQQAAADDIPPFDMDELPDDALARSQDEPPPPMADPLPRSTTAPEQQRSANVRAVQTSPAEVAGAQGQVQVPAARATSSPIETSGVQAALAAQGFNGLDFGFGAFPIITLQTSGNFETSEGGILGTSFECVVLGSSPKYICKNNQKGPAEDFFYSYDRVTTTSGDDCENVIANWRKQGWTYEWKRYVDVQASLVSDDEDNGQLVILSIPPTSIPRFSGYIATLAGRMNKPVSQVVTRCEVGPKITKVAYPFSPWAFNYARDI